MSNPLAPHPDPELWIRLADQDLPPGEAVRLELHLDECDDCRSRFRLLEEALAEYGRFHEHVLKPSLPPPPREWQRLFPAAQVGQAVPPASSHLGQAAPCLPKARPLWLPWMAAAAAAFAAVVLLIRLGHTPPVDAAELLRKAAVAEQSAPHPNRRIRIRTRRYTWNRPARLTTVPPRVEAVEAAQIEALFEEAGFSWDDPLSSQAFSHWRETVPDRRDEVTALSAPGSVKSYLIRTSPATGPLSEASLTLRAGDLHATECALRFRSNETIEMTELPAEQADSPDDQPHSSAAPATSVRPRENHPNRASSSDELHIVAALHAIAGDLGEPIEVTMLADQILVRATGLTSNRQQQLRAALADFPAVHLEFSEPPPAGRETLEPRHALAGAEPVNPLLDELQARLGTDTADTALADRLLDQSDSAIARAYALRSLARHFPNDDAEPWTPADQALLQGLVRDHLAALAASVTAIQRLLSPILPAAANPPTTPPPHADWRQVSETLPDSLNQLDRILNQASGDGQDIAARKARLAQTLAAIREQVAGAQ